MGKKTKQQKNKQPEFDAELDDQFDIQPEDLSASNSQPEGQEKNKKISGKKSLQSVFAEILKQDEDEGNKQLKKKEKRIKKEKLAKLQQNNRNQHKQEEDELTKGHQKTDVSFKYVRNKELEDDLKAKTLNGVVKVLNLISTHKKKVKEDQGQQ